MRYKFIQAVYIPTPYTANGLEQYEYGFAIRNSRLVRGEFL